MFVYILLGLTAASLILTFIVFTKLLVHTTHMEKYQQKDNEALNQLRDSLIAQYNQTQQENASKSSALSAQVQNLFNAHDLRFEERQTLTLKILQDSLQKGASDSRQQLREALADSATNISKRVEQLTTTTEQKLKDINDSVEKRLSSGFEKTNETFIDVIKRLAMIDEAQKKINELSGNVLSLQEILNDKRSRGAFGEVQLSALINNMVPPQHYSFQHLLSNGKRPDCMLFLPEPTGNIAIDAKFPLENFRLLMDSSLAPHQRTQAEKQFKIDIRKHILDISEKYILSGETADGAVMFIPAEAIFAEIHAHHVDLVSYAQQAKVWLVSPTTMMAILTTARAVLKDAATRKQVHEIQKHLRLLADDFERFQMRMDNLAKRVEQTHTDVQQVHISSRKITQRFIHIDKAEFDHLKNEPQILASVE